LYEYWGNVIPDWYQFNVVVVLYVFLIVMVSKHDSIPLYPDYERSLTHQELCTLPEHLSSSPAFSVVRVTRSLVLCVDRFSPISFGHCLVCPSIYGFWLPPFGIFTLLAIVLSVRRFTDSEYPFGIFKLFLPGTAAATVWLIGDESKIKGCKHIRLIASITDKCYFSIP
jgi:hypothetical protein